MVRLYKAKKGLRVKIVEVNWKKKGREFRPFKQEHHHHFIYDESTNEMYTYSRFSGDNILNYQSGGEKAFKPLPKEKKQLFRQLEEADVIRINFLNGSDNDLKRDFPELLEKAEQEYNKRFKNGRD